MHAPLFAILAGVLMADDPPPATAPPVPRPAPRTAPRTAARPVVIAHRGASGERPEHTLAAYALAIEQGADFIELDIVATKDGRLIARHDNQLELTTDVATRRAFADRRTTRSVDGVEHTGWFTEDFTLGEVKRLRAIERVPKVRPANAEHDGRYEVPTLGEVIALVQQAERDTGRSVGLYIEIKHPTHFADAGLPIEVALVETLHAAGYRDADDPVVVQSFEVGSLKRLDTMTDLRLTQLLWTSGKPWDVEKAGGTLTYAEMATAAGLRAIAAYAEGVGPEKNAFLIPRDGDGNLLVDRATTFVADAHAAGLVVHPYTFRAEPAFLPADVDSLEELLRIYLALGIDGVITDHPAIGVRALCR